MEITLNIPDELAQRVAVAGKDPARVALEALVLEGYRAQQLSESAVRRMLGFETRMQAHAFLKEHGVYLQYTADDLDRDRRVSDQFIAERRDKVQPPNQE